MRLGLLGVCLAVAALVGWSCQQNSTITGGSSTGSIDFSYSGGGCQIVATLDGGSPVTETAVSGSFTLYAGVTNGSHTVAITANSNTNTCTFNVEGGEKMISASGMCSTPVFSCP